MDSVDSSTNTNTHIDSNIDSNIDSENPNMFQKWWTQIQRVPYKLYIQILGFWFLHMYRIVLGWVKTYMVEPLEEYLDKYAKKEAKEAQWFQIYHLTSACCHNGLGIEDWYYQSEEMYYYPSTNDFPSYVRDEYEHILSHPLKLPSYSSELNQVPEIIETLLVAKNDNMYAFRSLPVMKTISKEKSQWKYEPKLSEVEFILVQYSHPRMPHGIILNIPRGYYLINNELFSPAFIQRHLELQKKYYVFDENYELIFVDHLCEKKSLDHTQYIVLLEETYEIQHINNKNEQQVEEESLEEIDSEDVDSNEADPGTVSPYVTLHCKTNSDIGSVSNDSDKDYDTDIDESVEKQGSNSWFAFLGW